MSTFLFALYENSNCWDVGGGGLVGDGAALKRAGVPGDRPFHEKLGGRGALSGSS